MKLEILSWLLSKQSTHQGRPGADPLVNETTDPAAAVREALLVVAFELRTANRMVMITVGASKGVKEPDRPSARPGRAANLA